MSDPTTTTAPPDTGHGWRAALIRDVMKSTLTVRLDKAPTVTFRPTDGPEVGAAPGLADIVMTSVDGGVRWSVHGVTVSAGEGLGRYFRRQYRDGTWPKETPAWVQALADAAARGGLVWPSHLCALCGYEVEPNPIPGGEAWVHAAGFDGEHRVREVSVDTGSGERTVYAAEELS